MQETKVIFFEEQAVAVLPSNELGSQWLKRDDMPSLGHRKRFGGKWWEIVKVWPLDLSPVTLCFCRYVGTQKPTLG